MEETGERKILESIQKNDSISGKKFVHEIVFEIENKTNNEIIIDGFHIEKFYKKGNFQIFISPGKNIDKTGD